MKKQTIKIACITLAMFATSGCHKKLDFRNAEISKGKLYEMGANEPFTGKITNVPLSKIPTNSLAKFVKTFDAIRPQDLVSKLISRDSIAAYNRIEEGQILCDTVLEKGILGGDADCKVPGSDVPLFKIPYKQGQINGEFLIYDPNKANSIIADAKFVNDQLDGKSTIRSNAGMPIHKREWKNGVGNGLEERFDETTGKLIFSASLLDGLIEGEVLRYSNDGKILLQRTHHVKGYQDGKGEEFDPITGKLFRTTFWKDGRRLDDIDGAQFNAAQESNAKTDECVNLWTTAFRKEVGNDVLITTDQISEWETSCKEGKKPN